jgi:hypothetical protein
MLSCVVSTMPMEVLTGDVIDGGRSVAEHGPHLPHLSSSPRGAVGGRADRGAAGRRRTVSAEVRPMPWSDRQYTRACQRMLSCIVSTAPMVVLTGDAVGGVRRC